MRHRLSAERAPRRGFVMVIFLGLAAIVAIALGAVLTSNVHQGTVAVRVADEMRARAIAESCLSKGVAVAIGHFRARGGEAFDFDRLLDPNGVAGDQDDHVFSNTGSPGAIVYVPADAQGTGTEGLYRYSFERVDPDGTGPAPEGACLLRFDDNADDNVPGYSAQTSNTNGVVEGDGENVNNRDRDGSIAVTAIGLYPVLPGVTEPDAYARAHARITMKQFFSASAAPAMYVDGTVRVVGTEVELCGTGGLTASSVDFSNGSCACGSTYAGDINGSTTTPSAMTQCLPSECPRVLSPVSVMNREALPVAPGTGSAGYHVDFPTACHQYGETIGEPPPRFVATDPVTANEATAVTATAHLHPERTGNFHTSTDPIPMRAEAHLRVSVRTDGAVFVWDGRPRPAAAAIPSRDDVDTGLAITPPRCDGFPARPETTDASAKHAVCSAAHSASTCRLTPEPFDEERCQLNTTCDVDTPCGSGETCEAGVCMTPTRCDRFDAPGYASAAPNTSDKHAICNAILSGSTCAITSNPREPLFCQLPNTQLVDCGAVSAANVSRPLGASAVVVGGVTVPGWPDTKTPPAVVRNPALTPNATNGNSSSVPLNNSSADRAAARLCWRMVAQLDDGPGHVDDGFSPSSPEWEVADGVGTAFALTTLTVPNIATDTSRFPQNIEPPGGAAPPGHRRATIADVAGGFDASQLGSLALLQPIVRKVGPGSFELLGFDNTTSRRLPTPATLFVDGDLRVRSGARLDGVSIAVTGSLTIEDNVTIVGMGVPSTTQQLTHPHGQAGVDACTDEAGVTFSGARNAWLGFGSRSITHATSANTARDRYALRVGGGLVVQGSANIFGKISVVGDAVFRGPTCAVGGVAAQGATGGALFASGCSAMADCALAETGLCFGGPASVIGSVFSVEHIVMNGGFNAQRGTRDCSTGTCVSPGNPGFKIAQIVGRSNICVGGGPGASASRIVGQILADNDAGIVLLEGNVTIVQTGEVGVGFGTRRTTWIDNSW